MELSEKSKRKRVVNFTLDEKVLLAKLVNDRKLIIESKCTDGKAVAQKKVAWEEITFEFNSNLMVHERDTITLKRAWDNLKAMTRKVKASERGHLIRNGNGHSCPPLPPEQVAIMNLVEEASPALKCENKNRNDSDTAAVNAVNNFQDEPSATAAEMIFISPDLPSTIEQKNIENSDEDGYKDTETDDVFQSQTTPSRRATDFIRHEALLRVRALEKRNKIETEILKNKLKREEVLLETANIEQKRTLLLLQAAQLEVDFQNKRLAQLNP